MLPALPLAAKIGLPVGVVVLSIGVYLAWQYHQQEIGREMERADHMADLIKQQQEVMGHYIVGEAIKRRSVERAMAAKDRFYARMRESKQEAVSHETVILPEFQETPECAVSPRIVRDVNRWARVLNDTAAERVDAPSGADPSVSGAGSTPGPSGAGDAGGSGRTDP